MAGPIRKKLGELLVEAGVIDATQLHSALGHQRRWGGRIGQAIVDLKMATEEQILATLAAKLAYARIPLRSIEEGPRLALALHLVPHDFAERNQVLAYAADPVSLWVAMADPTNVSVIDELAFRTGRKLRIGIAGDREIEEAIRRHYQAEPMGMEAIAFEELDPGPVEMVGPLDALHDHGVDAYFVRTGPPTTPPPARAVPVGSRVESVLEGLERIGGTPGCPSEAAHLSRFAAALVRVLVKKGLVGEEELAQAYAEAKRPTPRR